MRYALPLLALLLTGIPVAASAQLSSCPADHPVSRAITERFLTAPTYAQDRVDTGIAGLGVTDIRVLGTLDAVTCKQIRQHMAEQPGWAWTAYRIGSRYVVALRRSTPSSGYRMDMMPLAVLDGSFNVLRVLGM